MHVNCVNFKEIKETVFSASVREMLAYNKFRNSIDCVFKRISNLDISKLWMLIRVKVSNKWYRRFMCDAGYNDAAFQDNYLISPNPYIPSCTVRSD